MGKYDPDQIKENNPIEGVVGKYMDLKQNGAEFKGLCPFHSEKTPSFSVVPSKGFYHCFGCGAHGDAIDFQAEISNCSFQDACDILGGTKEDTGKRKRRAALPQKDVYEGIEPIIPGQGAPTIISGERTPKIWNPKRGNFTHYTPSAHYPYLTAKRELYGHVLRVDFGDGKKITPAIMYCKLPDGTEGFCHYTFPEPRPLYNLDRLHDSKKKVPVLVVEGEKAAEAARELLPAYTVVTWSGGTGAIKKTDWSPLKNRDVLIWPDADKPGLEAGHEIAALLSQIAKSVKLLDWDKSKEKGWDAFDALEEGWDTSITVSWAKEHILWTPPEEEEKPPLPEPPPDMQEAPDAVPEPPENETSWNFEEYFRPLGHNRDIFFYMPMRSGQIIKLSASAHVPNNYHILAPVNSWEDGFKGRRGVDWNRAYEYCIELCYKMGYFDPHERLRGRGAWKDKGRNVLHLGTHVYVDGEDYAPHKVPSWFIYQGESPLFVERAKPATDKEATKLMEICMGCSWDKDVSGILLSGWIALAPLSGLLKWRPHIWLTAASSSGKTWVMDNIMKPVLGNFHRYFAGSTTEAAIRQKMGQDALPIIFDEAEGETRDAKKRIQSVVELARIASSGGDISKGSADGTGQSYSMRSMYCFASINVSISHFADENRITKLVLRKDDKPDADDYYANLHQQALDTFTEEYSAKMLSRAVENMDTILVNAEVFVRAASKVLKSARTASQLGHLLAGAYFCRHTTKISYAAAEKWIKDQDWSDHGVVDKKDEGRLLDLIATYRVRMTTQDGPREATIGELILIIDNGWDDNDCGVKKAIAEKELRRFGIKVEIGYVYIANRCDPLRSKVLKDTQWADGWYRVLKDLPDADTTPAIYFSAGINSRATKVPVALFKEGVEG